ncbi:MAG: 4Fe-4S dicluster domain-containing protein [Desulfovibrio sp.]|jgi:molybdopterin-containing oxidoreductase family iron-sulfur binding subunit|nr:4Fe-4S dicluster domain-containing protein [Desulfovibrio sp.]
MSLSRRRFLLLASSALATPPAAAAGGQYLAAPGALSAGRWALVMDTRRLARPELRESIINACHAFHNVLSRPGPRQMAWIRQQDFSSVFTDQVPPVMPAELSSRKILILCNHCANPPCVRVCPTGAAFLREDGIVGMDFHRCIGCRYCMAACPFGARSFNFEKPRLAAVHPAFPPRTRGVVEKCTFCAERLAAGLPPLCVEVSEGAIVFGDLQDPSSPVSALLTENFSLRRKPELGTQPGVYYIL